MITDPLVSVIIPCYNSEAYVAFAIGSSLNQTYNNVEVIVVNDGSTDSSLEIIGSFKKEILLIDQENKGQAIARNEGIEASHGKYIAFLDADDYWEKEFISKLVEAIERSKAGIAYCGWQNVGLSGGRGKPFIPPDYENNLKKEQLLIENTRWPIHAALTRSDLVKSFGGFPTKWKTCEDFALWAEVGTGNRIILVPEVLSYYRHHSDSQVTANQLRIAIDHWLIQFEFKKKHPDIYIKIGRKRFREITHGELMRRGYICYWDRNLESARRIFRMVMKTGYGSLKDWKYMLPSILPLSIHKMLVRLLENNKETVA